MGNSYLEDKYKDYEQREFKLPSAHELITTLDAKFRFFIQKEAARKVPKWLRVLKKRPLSVVVQELLPDVDFSDTNALTGEDFKRLVLRMLNCVNELTNDEKYFKLAQKKGCTPLAVAGCEVFKSGAVTIDMMHEFEHFFRNLIEANFENKENPEFERDLRLKELLETYNRFIAVISPLFSDSREEEKILQHSLLALFITRTDPDVIETIFTEVAKHLGSSPPSKETIKNIFMQHAPSCYLTTVTEEKVKVVILKNEDETQEQFAAVVPPNNFYFTDSDSEECDTAAYQHDTFPIEGTLKYIEEYIGGHDCSVFRPDGHKVFWGDLEESDITSLEGTYYVLTRLDSMNPKASAVTVVAQSAWPAIERNKIPNELRYMPQPNDLPCLDPRYIRLMATCKIENGTVIPNKKKVFI